MIKQRNITADLLKGLAILAMIQVHILELFAMQGIYDSDIGSILLFIGGPPAAPVFMSVMGYFIAASNNKFKADLLRGIKLIGMGLILNLGLNFNLFINIYNGTFDISPWPYLFGVDILFLAGFSIIIIGAFKLMLKNNPLFYFMIILFVFFIGNFLPTISESGPVAYIAAFFFGENWWSYFPLIPWLVYPLLGVLFYIIEPRIFHIINNRTYIFIIVFLSGLLLLVSINYGISIASDLEKYYHHSYPYFLFISNFMIFWIGVINIVSKLPGNYISNFIQWMGRNVTVFYVIQWLLIGNIGTALYKTQSLIQLFIWFVVIVLVTTIFTFFYVKIKSTYLKEIKNLLTK